MVSLKDLAKGFLESATNKTIEEIQDTIISAGTSAAVELVCDLASARFGLPSVTCRKVGKIVVTELARKLRARLRNPR